MTLLNILPSYQGDSLSSNLRKNPTMLKSNSSYRKDNQRNKSFVDRSKFKCYNCGIDGNFSNKYRKPNTEKEGNDSADIDYKRKYYDLLI